MSANAPAHAGAIDVAGGVERMMGDRRLFLRVLGRFYSGYRSIPDEMRTAVAAGDAGCALRLAHNLKGAAGMIEARALYQKALMLEQALREHSDDFHGELRSVELELERVLAQARTLLETGEPPAGA